MEIEKKETETSQKIDETQNNEDESLNDDELQKIKNVIEQFKTPEALAKSKLSTDKEFSKLQSEKKALETLLKEGQKKLAKSNKNYLLELYIDDPEKADEISLELYKKRVDELEDISESKYEYRTDEEGNEYYKKSDIEKMIEEKINKMKIIEKKETFQTEKKQTREELIANFKTENELSGEEEVIFNEIFDDLTEGLELNNDKLKKMLDASYKVFYKNNIDANNEIKTKKNKAGILTIKNTSGESITYTEADKNAAKSVNMPIEKYIELKNKFKF